MNYLLATLICMKHALLCWDICYRAGDLLRVKQNTGPPSGGYRDMECPGNSKCRSNKLLVRPLFTVVFGKGQIGWEKRVGGKKVVLCPQAKMGKKKIQYPRKLTKSCHVYSVHVCVYVCDQSWPFRVCGVLQCCLKSYFQAISL